MNQYFVYILECSDSSYYVWVTNNLEIRLNEHNFSENKNSYTFSRRPVKLVFYEIFSHIHEAIEAEKQLKWWSRKKKKALIEWKIDSLKKFSECQNYSHSKYFS